MALLQAADGVQVRYGAHAIADEDALVRPLRQLCGIVGGAAEKQRLGLAAAPAVHGDGHTRVDANTDPGRELAVADRLTGGLDRTLESVREGAVRQLFDRESTVQGLDYETVVVGTVAAPAVVSSGSASRTAQPHTQ
jgi:hypothetical protein